MRGEILGSVASAIGGVILPRHVGATTLLWSITGTTQITEDAANATYTVSYANALAPGQSATIAVASTAGTATDGVDYTGAATTLTFTGGGATAKTLAVTIIEDTIVEGTEDFRVTLASPSVGQLATSQVITAIADEDASLLTWSVSGSTSIDEGDAGTYTVSYTGATLAPGQQATISVATASGALSWPDASAGSDYTALSTVLTFTGGGVTQKTVAVSTIDDTDIEGTEDFRVTIGGASSGSLAASQVNTVIVDDDADDFVGDAVTFDGANDYLTRGGVLSGVSPSRKAWGEVIYRKSSAIGTNETFWEFGSGSGGTRLNHHSFGSPPNCLLLTVRGTSGELYSIRATVGMNNDGNWHHLAWYVDTDHAAGAKIGKLVHDGVDVSGVAADSDAAFDVDWTAGASNFYFLAQSAGPANGKYSGDVFRIIVAPGQNFDISSPANLTKLWNSGTGKPVDVGADGSIPTGTAPTVLLNLDDGETPADNFAANAGSGGGMSVTGALAVAASSPTD